MRRELEMRKLLSILVLSATLMLLLVPSAAADGYMEVMPGDAEFAATFGSDSFGDLWIELEGVGHEVPGGDDYIRGGPVGGWHLAPSPFGLGLINGIFQHGIPLGFEFEFWGETYDDVWLATNGYLLFRSPTPDWKNGGLEWRLDWDWWNGLDPILQLLFSPWRLFPVGDSWNWWPWQLPIAEPPNNFIAPYWTDLWMGDNGFQHVTGVTPVCMLWDPGPPWHHCDWWEYVANTVVVPRPRGRLMFDTVGEAPNRIFVAEWLRAKNAHTSNLTTFQAQIFEGSNAILFLYKDFMPKTATAAYFEIPSVLAGLEDAAGRNSAGSVYVAPGLPGWPSGREFAFAMWQPTGPNPKGVPEWPWQVILRAFNIQYPYLPAPFAAGDMLGFIPT
jgi:hypothetical protein